jgi:hypothetical protein
MSALNFAKKLNKKSNSHHFIIVTDKIIDEKIDNTTFVLLPTETKLFVGGWFNWMLKYYPIKVAKEIGYEYVIFLDADWRIRESYNENGILKLFDFMKENDIDICFERPYNIGNAKKEGIHCIFSHKIEFYKLLETNEYDEGHACNEQFLILKNTDKLEKFVKKFEELYHKSTENNIWAFCEGLEIGMSMAHAKMNMNWGGWEPYLRDMFEFTCKAGGINIRY